MTSTRRIVALATLIPNPLNPRGAVDRSARETRELAASIRETGLLQAPLITPHNVIIFGHRRVVACELAGLTEIGVDVRDLTEAQQLTVMLTENLQREQLTPVQAALGCEALHARGVTVEQLSASLGLALSAVKRYLVLAVMPPLLRDAFANTAPLGFIDLLVQLPTEDQQVSIGLRAIRDGWRLEELKKAVVAILRPRDAIDPTPAPHLGRVELIDLLSRAQSAVLRTPALARDDVIWEWCTRLGRTVAEARA